MSTTGHDTLVQVGEHECSTDIRSLQPATRHCPAVTLVVAAQHLTTEQLLPTTATRRLCRAVCGEWSVRYGSAVSVVCVLWQWLLLAVWVALGASTASFGLVASIVSLIGGLGQHSGCGRLRCVMHLEGHLCQPAVVKVQCAVD